MPAFVNKGNVSSLYGFEKALDILAAGPNMVVMVKKVWEGNQQL
jgi:hypothetical protein